MSESGPDLAALGYRMLPKQILDKISPELNEEIVRSVIRDAERARRQAWLALYLGFLGLVICAATACYYVRLDAPVQGAFIFTSAAASVVGAFIGHRALSGRKRPRA